MDLRKIGFQLPETIKFDEETLSDTYGKLVAEPLERGFGTTLGQCAQKDSAVLNRRRRCDGCKDTWRPA